MKKRIVEKKKILGLGFLLLGLLISLVLVRRNQDFREKAMSPHQSSFLSCRVGAFSKRPAITDNFSSPTLNLKYWNQWVYPAGKEDKVTHSIERRQLQVDITADSSYLAGTTATMWLVSGDYSVEVDLTHFQPTGTTTTPGFGHTDLTINKYGAWEPNLAIGIDRWQDTYRIYSWYNNQSTGESGPIADLINLSSGGPIRVNVERIGETTNLYYQTSSQTSYNLIASTDKLATEDVYFALNSAYNPPNPSVVSKFDNFVLSCPTYAAVFPGGEEGDGEGGRGGSR